jgi:hypothetical protein
MITAATVRSLAIAALGVAALAGCAAAPPPKSVGPDTYTVSVPVHSGNPAAAKEEGMQQAIRFCAANIKYVVPQHDTVADCTAHGGCAAVELTFLCVFSDDARYAAYVLGKDVLEKLREAAPYETGPPMEAPPKSQK